MNRRGHRGTQRKGRGGLDVFPLLMRSCLRDDRKDDWVPQAHEVRGGGLLALLAGSG